MKWGLRSKGEEGRVQDLETANAQLREKLIAAETKLGLQETQFCAIDIERLAGCAERGFNPKCVFDAGASNGWWSRLLVKTFPEAQFCLFEPLADVESDYKNLLAETLAENPGFKLFKTALGSRSGSTVFRRSKDVYGSSLLNAGLPDTLELEVPVTTIDEVIERENLPAPDLLKMDVQGGEMEILLGAEKSLPKMELLLVETWLSRVYGSETPLYHEIVNWLLPRGFHLIDFTGSFRGGRGELLSQDTLFVNESSPVAKDFTF